MDKLLATAEVRKRDFLIAQEKKFQKEREMEGDEFAGKEKFVTGAYKRQQEEMRKAEEAERLREGNNVARGANGRK
jgi:coiled-coil domain-containing protein 55